MDHRIALKPNTPLCLCNNKGEVFHCVIEKEIGRGGSCIVYEASRITDTGDKTLYRVKEFYPYKLDIRRDENNCLIPSHNHCEIFDQGREQLRADFSKTNKLFYSDNNYSALINQLDVYKQNGTSYILSAYSSSKTLTTYIPESLKECIAIVKQVAYVLGNIHQQGYLYLDAKPDNILVVDGYQKQVQLFDFDSLLSIADLNASRTNCSNIRLSYSKGFAPIELQTAKAKRLGVHTDVYSVGALLFYLLFGTTPTAPDCEIDAEFDFSNIKYDSNKYDDKLFGTLSDFFHNALAVYYADRYQSMQEVVEQLQTIEMYADTTVPRIYSTKISSVKCFYGRECEFDRLDKLLDNPNHNCLFITGMGGIGKSTFVKEYLMSRRAKFDTILYVHYKDSIEATITDDDNIEINTLRQEDTQKGEKYFGKKLKKIRELVRNTYSVLVIDNFDGKIDEDFRKLLGTDLKVVLLSRTAPTYQNSQTMELSAIEDTYALRSIFEHNLGRSITDSEQPAFSRILQQIECHTLVLELIAKQIANNRYITISSAASLTDKYGFSSIAPEKVDYEKDGKPTNDTIGNIIDALFESSGLSNSKRILMKVASLLGDNGIDINQFQKIMQIQSKDDLNDLYKDGWLILSGNVMSMHRVIQDSVRRWEWTKECIDAAERFLTYFYVEIRLESTKNNYPKKLLKLITWADSELPPELKDKWIFQKLIARRDHRMKKVKQWQEKQFDKQGLVGKVNRERWARRLDEAPANIEKLSSLLIQSEDILRQCKRDPTIKSNDVYVNLLYVTVLNTPRYKEEYILAETSRIFSDDETDFVLNGTAELLDESESRNPVTIMQLYAMAVLIHADNERFEASEKLLEQAEHVADKVHHHKVYALYYNLLADYYDVLLDGCYDTIDHGEEQLLNKMLDAIEKALRYSKRELSYDGNHIYVQNILAKATIMMRSGRGTEKEIGKLIDSAKKIIAENTSQYADVRLHYYLVCAWYFALLHDSAKSTEAFVKEAQELSNIITPTDLQRIEEVIIPCANMFFELGQHNRSMSLLYEGTRMCTKHANAESYARIKQELCNHLWEVGIEGQYFDLCQKIIELIEIENNDIIEPKNKVVIPKEVRDIISQSTT